MILASVIGACALVVVSAGMILRAPLRRRRRKPGTQMILASPHKDDLHLRRVRPYGQLLLDESPWEGGRLIMRPVEGDYETRWAHMTLCVFMGWCEDVTAEISGWAQEWGAI